MLDWCEKSMAQRVECRNRWHEMNGILFCQQFDRLFKSIFDGKALLIARIFKDYFQILLPVLFRLAILKICRWYRCVWAFCKSMSCLKIKQIIEQWAESSSNPTIVRFDRLKYTLSLWSFDVLSQDNNVSNYFSLKQMLFDDWIEDLAARLWPNDVIRFVSSLLLLCYFFVIRSFAPTTRIPFYSRRVHIFSLSHFYQMDMFLKRLQAPRTGIYMYTHSMNRNALKNVGKLWKTCSTFRCFFSSIPHIHSQHNDIALFSNPVSSRRYAMQSM